jgi:guanine deaminase
VGMKGRLGAFQEGMCWDVQEIDLTTTAAAGPVDLFGWESWEEVVAKWVWNGDDRNVRRVWVAGQLVHERKGNSC